jgi:hypothetical protein
MPPITEISPERLRERHHLSPQQINSIFGQEVIKESFKEKGETLERVAEFIRVSDAITASGISFIPLKGPVLSYRLYGDATWRYYNDLDVLVDVSSMKHTIHVLEGLGYRTETIVFPQKKRKQNRLLNCAHHISFVHPEEQVRIELHWRLIRAISVRISRLHQLVMENRTTIDFAGRKFSVLSNEMELLYMVIHGGHHQWAWLKWLVDINDFLKSQRIKWQLFEELTGKLKAGRLVALCNEILSEYFPGGPLMTCSAAASGYMIRFSKKRIEGDDLIGHNSNKTMLQFLYFLFIAYPGFSYRIRPVSNIIGNSIFFGRIGRLLKQG